MKNRNQASAWILAAVFVLALRVCGFAAEPSPHVCFRATDADRDGKVDFREFKGVFSDAEKKHFDEIDSNRDGVLSHDEYHYSLGHGKNESSEEHKRVLPDLSK